jgi:hypothetical protein
MASLFRADSRQTKDDQCASHGRWRGGRVASFLKISRIIAFSGRKINIEVFENVQLY